MSRSRGRVLDDGQQGNQVLDLTGEQQPTQPHDLIGDPAPIQGRDDRGELRAPTTQHRRRQAPTRDAVPDPLGDRGGLVVDRLEALHVHLTGVGPGRARNGSTGTAESARNGEATRLATSSTSWSLRQLVDRGNTSAGSPAAVTKQAGKLPNVVALAPRNA